MVRAGEASLPLTDGTSTRTSSTAFRHCYPVAGVCVLLLVSLQPGSVSIF